MSMQTAEGVSAFRRTTLAIVLFLGPAALSAQNTQVYEPGNGVSLPEVISKVDAEYTEEARAARIQGTVGLAMVVQADGTVGEVGVEQPLDPGLDREAVKAAKQWRFKPGMREKKPVAVRITVLITFALR
jgi:periplasmic protein TonB